MERWREPSDEKSMKLTLKGRTSGREGGQRATEQKRATRTESTAVEEREIGAFLLFSSPLQPTHLCLLFPPKTPPSSSSTLLSSDSSAKELVVMRDDKHKTPTQKKKSLAPFLDSSCLSQAHKAIETKSMVKTKKSIGFISDEERQRKVKARWNSIDWPEWTLTLKSGK